MLFDMKTKDKRVVSIKEALKLGSSEFDTPIEAQDFIERKGLKASFVDANGVPHYYDTELGVTEEV